MKLFIYDDDERLSTMQTELIQSAAKASAQRGGAGGNCCAELTILADSEEMRALNRDARGVDSVTDVLSFPALNYAGNRQAVGVDSALDYVEGKLYLGEILICHDRAAEQAKEYGHSIERELAFLTAHGTLHLLGYDHESEEGEREMFALQKKILEQMAINN